MSKRTAEIRTAAAGPNDDIGEAKRLELYRSQMRIRDAEQRAYDLFLQNLVKGTSHLSLGQEAVAAGFGTAMQPGDLSFCTYRGHARTLARGVTVEKVMGELMQRDNGLMRGKGGSMHLTSTEHGVMGSYAIIGAHLPIACGAAWRAQYKGDKDVSVCFFGDGTTNIGAFHEALNMAAVWKAPVVFVCENNLYMEYTAISDVTAVEHPAADRASAYGLDSNIVDCNGVEAGHVVARTAWDRTRAAVAVGIAREMERDPSVVLIGEDVGAAGGVFKLTEGLFERFGADRVRDTPISEQAIVGAAMGAAMTGLRPVAELMFSDFFAVA